MRREQDRTALAPELLDQLTELPRGDGVHPGSRFVQEQDGRIRDQPAREVHALLHAARELFDGLVGAGRKADALEEGVHPGPISRDGSL